MKISAITYPGDQGDLARDVEEPVGLDGLGVGPHSRGRGLRKHNLASCGVTARGPMR